MPEEVFRKIVNELSIFGYKNTVKLHRYNEPLALGLIFDRIRYLRKRLPQANIGFHSNGDYVTKENLRQLEETGLTFMKISLYIDFKGNREEQVMRARKHCEDYLAKRELEGHRIEDKGYLINYIVPMDKMHVSLYIADIALQWVDRGGTIGGYSNRTRVSPCEGPFNGMFIDWTGDVLPCCNLRGDIESHKPYILGNVKDLSLQKIFYSEVANKLRAKLIGFNKKDGVCSACQYGIFYNTLLTRALLNNKLKKICYM